MKSKSRSNTDRNGYGASKGASPGSRHRVRNHAVGPEAAGQLLEQLHEFFDYFLYYLTAKKDSVKVSLRGLALTVGLSVLAIFVTCVMLSASVSLVFSGLVFGGAELLGGPLWLSELLVGSMALIVLGCVLKHSITRLNQAKERTVEKYEQRQARQQTHYGHTVRDQAAAARSESN